MSRGPLVIEWLRVLSSALSARQLYRTDHPRVVDAVAALAVASRHLIGDREDVSLFMIEGRLACDGVAVAGAGPVAARVFGALSACGYDRLTLARGVTAAELQDLVCACAGVARDGAKGGTTHLQSSPNLRFSVFDVATSAPSVVRAGPAAASLDPRRLPDLWRGIGEAQTIDADLLDSLLAPIMRIVTAGGGGEMLPLAALQTHDDYTATHITNVAVLTMALAEAMGLPPAAVRSIGVAALLHDIGKMRVPAAILNSRTRLTADELAIMRRHPETGARMLMATRGAPPLAAIVAFEHHLQANGGGYPDVPAGWRVNPASAMTHVADVYDALRTHRPYRAALDHERIADLMTRDRGTVFPAELLDAFFEHVVPRARPAPVAAGRDGVQAPG
jgi:putative nucleotidyltransferase with HDIG domain